MWGVHSSKESKVEGVAACKSLAEAVQRDVALANCLSGSCAQIFTHGPRSTALNAEFAKPEAPSTTKVDKLYIHSPYVATALWNHPERYEAYLTEQFKLADTLRAEGVVFHFVKKPAEEFVAVMQRLRPILAKHTAKFIFETPAFNPHPTQSYETPAKLNAFCRAMQKACTPWGLCIDTSHLWRSGVDLSTWEQAKEWFEGLEFPKRVELIHFNANLEENFGRGRDVHQIPLAATDGIWARFVTPELRRKHDTLRPRDRELLQGSGFFFIVQWAKKNKVPLIFEMNCGTIEDARFLFDILKLDAAAT